jgi:ATP-dependent DNA ligase
MEAKLQERLPEGTDWQYEPKWDGFRCLVFRDGDKIALQSKSGQPLDRYFPELIDALAQLKARRFVLDGEIVIPESDGRTLSFDQLLQRIHPAKSRVQRLARETPATLIVFDLLVGEQGESLTDLPLKERRAELERFAKRHLKDREHIVLSAVTTKFSLAKRWFEKTGTGLDGVIAKRLDLPYQTGNRAGMVKVKKLRTADCVVGGFRYGSKSKVVGSLLLGLYNPEGLLDQCGFTSSFTAAQRAELTPKVEKLIEPPGFTGAAPGGPSRWSTERSTEWQPLKPVLVAEVRYDHFTGERFRHGTTFLRWRPDKAPRQCTREQVKSESSFGLPDFIA